MSVVSVNDYSYPSGWDTRECADERARYYCRQLESGSILNFRCPPFALSRESIEFLNSQNLNLSIVHKNVSYLPATNVLSGISGSHASHERIRRILREFSDAAAAFLAEFLPRYRDFAKVDYANFRPVEESGRQLPLHKRNDLLHVDASRSRPTGGARILRIFVNIHPERPRVWKTGMPFTDLARQYARQAGLDRHAMSTIGARLRQVTTGLTAYDAFMLRFHNFLKESCEFQEKSPQFINEFPPMATWLVFSDGVPHAVLSGQNALDQTFIVPVEGLVAPEESPLRILERLRGQALVEKLLRRSGERAA
jgi:hypothetical protein